MATLSSLLGGIYTGPQGESGVSGTSGTSGTSGFSGRSGFSGSAGPSNVLNATDTTATGTYYPVFVDTAGTNTTPRIRSTATAFSFNPGTGEVSAVDFNSLSDLTLKTNVQGIENSWHIISQLRPVSFDWQHVGKSSFGFIAQEVEKIIPTVVSTSEQGAKTLSYLQIIPLLVAHVQEQDKTLKQMMDTIKQLSGD